MARSARTTTCGAIALALVTSLLSPSAALASNHITPVRVVGGPGHAALYGWGAATMPDGSVLVTDYWNFRVQHFEKDGTLRGTAIARDNRHLSPYDVAVDPRNGAMFIGDVDRDFNVDKYRADGTYERSFGGPSTFLYPAYLDVDSNGRVAVADSRGHKIVVYNGDTGVELFRFGTAGSGPGQLRTPRGIAFDANDRLYVADTNNNRIQVFSLGANSATYLSQWSVPVGDFRGLTVDKASGAVYLVNGGLGRIQKFSPTGQMLVEFGGYGSAPGRFLNGGRGITIDGDGNVWVGDMPGFRAQKFSPTGAFLQVVPDPPEPPPEGGFAMPGGVAVDGNGNIFVTDTYNWRVQKFSPNGAFDRQWGNRGVFNYARSIAVDPRDDTVVVANSDGQNAKKFTNDGTLLWTAEGVRSFALDVGPDGTIYAAQQVTNDIKVVSPSGAVLRTIGAGQLRNPRGIAVDADGSVWVSNVGSGIVKHLSSTGALLGQFGSFGSGPDQLTEASDVETDATRVFVSDRKLNLIKVWSKNGTFLGSFGGTGGTLGKLRTPQGMHLTPSGRLYVAEFGNERVQEFDVAG